MRDFYLSTSRNITGGAELQLETRFDENLGNFSLVRVSDVAKSVERDWPSVKFNTKLTANRKPEI